MNPSLKSHSYLDYIHIFGFLVGLLHLVGSGGCGTLHLEAPGRGAQRIKALPLGRPSLSAAGNYLSAGHQATASCPRLFCVCCWMTQVRK